MIEHEETVSELLSKIDFGSLEQVSPECAISASIKTSLVQKIRLTFHVGLGSSTDKLLSEARLQIATLAGGDTIVIGLGDWVSGGKLESEQSAVITVYTADPTLQAKIADYLLVHFLQWEVWSTSESVTVQITSKSA